jgi:CRP-like cAMP-binding protein
MSKYTHAKAVVARVLLLKRFSFLSDLAPAALTPLAERVVEARFDAGDTVLAKEAAVNSMHFLLEGEIEVRRGPRVRTLSTGEVLSEIEVLAALPSSPSSARAMASTRTLAIDRPSLIAAQEDSFPLQRAMLKAIGSADLSLRRQLGWSRIYETRDVHGDLEQGPQCSELGHRVASLRATRELRGLRIRTLGRLAADAKILDMSASEQLWHIGDRGDFAVQVLRGSLECRTDDTPPFRIGPDTLIGLAEAFADGHRWCDLTAASDVLMIRLDVENILDVLEDDADVAIDLVTTLASEVVKLEDAIVCSDSAIR